MQPGTYHGVVKGQTTVVLDKPMPLPDGTPVAVTPLALEPGQPATLLAVMAGEPHLAAEDVAALEQAMADGRRSLPPLDPFPGETENAGNS